jgi:hypothetical protein
MGCGWGVGLWYAGAGGLNPPVMGPGLSSSAPAAAAAAAKQSLTKTHQRRAAPRCSFPRGCSQNAGDPAPHCPLNPQANARSSLRQGGRSTWLAGAYAVAGACWCRRWFCTRTACTRRVVLAPASQPVDAKGACLDGGRKVDCPKDFAGPSPILVALTTTTSSLRGVYGCALEPASKAKIRGGACDCRLDRPYTAAYVALLCTRSTSLTTRAEGALWMRGVFS